MSDKVIDSPEYVEVCGERLARSKADEDRAVYGSPLGVVYVSYYLTHAAPWLVTLFIRRPNGALVTYQANAATVGEAAAMALHECTIADVEIVLRSLRPTGETVDA